MATPQVKDLSLRSPAGSSEVLLFTWPLQVGSGQDRHDNGIDIIDTIKFVCDELPSISSAFEEINLNHIDTACYKTMTNLVDRFNRAVDSIVALEKGTSLPAERLNKFAHPSLLRHILQLVYNAAVLDPDKLNNYEPFSPEVYGETSYELVQQMIKHVNVTNDDTFIDLGSGVGQVVLQMAGSFPLKSCIGIEKADTPARYAERMDLFFRQFMAWFGKRYCEYKLLKGDFLVDEHREKITSSSLVFVNNFAFGPNVDHQLKERFADLRDGARVVSSKSFCPLNFRITDRNLSDIGTIMHVSEIPPLKGSVSWTCKPVSYYLHVIDRTILERYFQRIKTQKGAENDHAGANTRTTRDRAKREANNQAVTNSQNSNSNTTRTNSPAAHVNNTTTSKTRQQQQQQQQQQPRNMEVETSTESDGDANTTNGNSNGSGGLPVARKVWSDWGSSKGGKSSQSDEEENNNNNNFLNTSSRTARTTTQKKRKKLTRKAAIASKSAAAAAQREAAAKERAEAAQASKDNSSKEDFGGNSTGGNSNAAKGRKGRLKKGARGKKNLKIAGLDVLHQETLLSTSLEAMTKKLPPAPGTIDQQLTSLLTENMDHAELDIPASPQDTPYALQILLDVLRSQYMAMIDQMKSKSYIPSIKRQIQLEQERKQRIKNRASQLDKQIKVLIDDSVALLKVRMNELGINVSSPNDLIAKAKEIVGRHKELQGVAKKIQSQVTVCELEQKRLLKKHLQHLPEYQRLYGGVNGKTKFHDLSQCGSGDLSEASAHELVLREIANTLTQRKKLVAQVSSIEKEANILEKSAEERRTAAALMAQGTNIILTNPQNSSACVNNNINSNQPLQLTTSNSHKHLNNFNLNHTNSSTTSSSSCTVTLNPVNNINSTTSLVPNNINNNTANTQPSITVTKTTGKTVRRSRDHRTRSQEWPDVPDVGKIEESNPEVLAQKILETGRKIEAGKLNSNSNANSSKLQQHQNLLNNQHHLQQQQQKHQHLINQNPHHIQQQHNEDKTYLNKYHHAHQQQQCSSSNEHLSSLVTGLQPDPSSLMPAPKQRENNLLSVSTSIRSHNNSNALTTGSILPKCELSGMRKTNNNNVPIVSIQESPKVANFEDRLKSIITSALNEDQEQRKAQQVVNQVQVEVSSSPQQSPIPKRSKHSLPNHPNSNFHAGSSNNHNSLSSIINVATHGMTHLNATTTISPITSTLPPPQAPPNGGGGLNKYNSNNNMLLQPINSSNMSSSQTVVNSSSSKSAKYHPNHNTNLNNLHNPHLSNMYAAQEHNLHRRRSSVSAANYDQFVASQQRERERELQMQQQQNKHNMVGHNPHNLSLEFKQPPPNMESHLQQRSSSREMLMEETANPVRSSSANSDSALQYYPPTRDRLMSMERSSSRESSHLINSQQQQPPSRPSSNSSQPDYTQVSPAKMALRRHLSQEKLNQVTTGSTTSASNSLPLIASTKTIGDLVNGEIERTLEITHQSIINAAVNMSTVGSASGERNPYLLERSLYNNDRERDHRSNDREREREREKERERERERERDRLIINNHAQRPERVHVKMTDDITNSANNFENINPRSSAQIGHHSSGRKSPYSNNLATLANVAYQHKTIPTNIQQQQHNILASSSISPSSLAAAPRNFNNNLQRDREFSHANSYHHLPTSTGSGKNSAANLSSSSTSSVASSSTTQRDYQPVTLPRAEMKPCIEAYFHDQQEHHQSQQQQQHLSTSSLSSSNSQKSNKDRHSSRNNRLNGTNPPLEGLAASLMASRKFREEQEERQKRAAASNANAGNHPNNEHHQQQNRQHHNVEHYNNAYGLQAASTLHNNHHNHGSPLKVELGVKRTSPMTNNYPRGAKVAHFSNDPPLTHGSGHTQNPYDCTNGGGSINNSNSKHHLGHHVTTTSKSTNSANVSGGSSRRGNKLNIEPLLMSPEINSIMGGDESRNLQHQASVNNRQTALHNNNNSHQHGHGHYNNYHQQQQQQLQNQHNSHHHHVQNINNRNSNNNSAASSSTLSNASAVLTNSNNIVGNRSADDDDVIAEDESHWQHRVSSGFDRLVAFASTELDKTRRSIDTDTVPSSISCNTSPDSGITHSSSNSDAARTFLSTSSTSSQLDLPISSGSSTSSGNSSFMSHHGHHHHHLGGSQEHLSDSSTKSIHSDVHAMAVSLKNCSSPQDPTAIDSPPLSDMGLPRTPSPNVAVNTPPPSSLQLNSSNSASNSLKIPLKYQRKSKTSLEKHYKKKFCERNWDYDCDELLAYSNSSSNTAADAAGNTNDQIDGVGGKDLEQQIHHQQQKQQQQQQHALHKSSKFRPKGKDWDWSMDSNSSSSQKAKCDLSLTVVNNNNNSAAVAATRTPQTLQ